MTVDSTEGILLATESPLPTPLSATETVEIAVRSEEGDPHVLGDEEGLRSFMAAPSPVMEEVLATSSSRLDRKTLGDAGGVSADWRLSPIGDSIGAIPASPHLEGRTRKKEDLE